MAASAERTRLAVKSDPMEQAHVAMEIFLLEGQERDLNASRTELEGHLRVTEAAQTERETSVEAARLKALELLSQRGFSFAPQYAAEMEELRKVVGKPAETAAALKIEIGMLVDQLGVLQNRLTVLRADLAEREAAIAATTRQPVPTSRESTTNIGGRR
jgi:hypothetical protein